MHPLKQKMVSLQWRLSAWRRATAACRILATVLAAAIALGVMDYVVRYDDSGLRIMSTFALAAAVMWALYRWWYLPSLNAITPLAAAQRVQNHFPQLRDTLASALEFLEQAEGDGAAGSPQLRRLVVAEAHAAVEELPLQEVIDRRPLLRAAWWLAVPAIVLTLCLAWNGRAVQTAAFRLVAPLGSAAWPRTNHLAFQKIPARVAAGQAFEAQLVDTAGPLPDDVQIEYRTANEGRRETTSEPMQRVGDTMIARRENVRQSFAFRATGGDDRAMPWQWVEVVESPRLEEFSIVIHPPEYTRLPTRSVQGHLEVLAGSGLEVRGTATEPLQAARILFDDAPPIAATITEADDHDRKVFHIEPTEWTAAKSGAYRVELTNDEGVAGVVGQWNLNVQSDPPPSVDWQQPSDDLYVTAVAVVPLQVVVHDNLAIAKVELQYSRRDPAQAANAKEVAESHIELYRGPDKPPLSMGEIVSASGESRTVNYDWDLAPLALAPGTQLTCHVEATDYRPGSVRTVTPRVVTIVTSEELNARIADRLAQIVRLLQRALTAQQATREKTHAAATRLQGSKALVSDDRAAMQSLELNQRQVGQLLVDAEVGVTALATALLNELKINQLLSAKPSESMARLLEEIERLSIGPLSAAESELVAARKSAEGIFGRENRSDRSIPASLDAAELQLLSASLTNASQSQNEIIASLQKLIKELSGESGLRQLARQVADLQQEQTAHAQATRKEIGLETLPLQLSELSSEQRSKLRQAAEGQGEIAKRFEAIAQAMGHLAESLSAEGSETAENAAGAASLARQLAIGTKMRQTIRDLQENRLGQALDREAEIVGELQQVLHVLSNSASDSPASLAESLRQAEQQRQAESQGVQAAMRRLQAELAPLVERQRNVIQATAKLNVERETNQPSYEDVARETEKLALAERELARIVREHGEQLTALGAVRISLEVAERRLALAAEKLENRETGSATQLAEHRALSRLEEILRAFDQAEAEAGGGPSAPAAGNAAGKQPQRQSTFELLELKLLRMLQADLNTRTQDHEARVADQNTSALAHKQAEVEREARELQADQRRLAELVEQMMIRDNGRVEK